MPTNKKSETARANGAKSRGPVTAEGLARSSRNSLTHGLATSALPPVSVVLPSESAADFQLLLDSYLDEFAPVGAIETELVQTMAATRWRLRRLAEIETNLLGNEIEHCAEYIDTEFSERDREPDASDRLAFVFKHLADGGQSLGLLIRYEGALSRSYARAFKQLQSLQSRHDKSARSRPQPNEPRPGEAAPVPLPIPDAPSTETQAPISAAAHHRYTCSDALERQGPPANCPRPGRLVPGVSGSARRQAVLHQRLGAGSRSR